MAKILTACGGLYIDSGTLKILKTDKGVSVVTTADVSSVTTYIDGCGIAFDETKFDIMTKNGRNPVITKKGTSAYPEKRIQGVCYSIMFDGDCFAKDEEGTVSYTVKVAPKLRTAKVEPTVEDKDKTTSTSDSSEDK